MILYITAILAVIYRLGKQSLPDGNGVIYFVPIEERRAIHLESNRVLR